jgi:hypothetical protein
LVGGTVFGAPGLLIGASLAGATELGYRLLGNLHPNKQPLESIGGSVSEAGLSIDHFRPVYSDSVSGKADALAARGSAFRVNILATLV